MARLWSRSIMRTALAFLLMVCCADGQLAASVKKSSEHKQSAKKQALDLVDIRSINPHIRLDIRYATTNNFTKTKLYSFPVCYLRKQVALNLDKVQLELETMGLGLKIWDGYRPLSVQKKFWELVPDERYVANPAKGSRHNRGCAVDVTLVTKDGHDVLMPTDFDCFTSKAHCSCTDLPEEAIQHRNLLARVMIKHGFTPLETEWWHFDDANWRSYEIMDIPLEALLTR